VMVALDAEFHLMNPDGKRIVPAGGFYKNDGMDFLNKTPDELLVSIHLPLHEGWKMNYRKLSRRGAIDFPVLGVAVALRLDTSGNCMEARIVLGGVASCPLRAFEAEKLLVGGSLTAEGSLTRIENTAQVAAKLAKPMDNTDMTLGFRKKMVTQFVAETIKEVLK